MVEPRLIAVRSQRYRVWDPMINKFADVLPTQRQLSRPERQAQLCVAIVEGWFTSRDDGVAVSSDSMDAVDAPLARFMFVRAR